MTTTTIARAWMIRRKDGLTLGFTDHDVALSFDGVRFRPDHGMAARALVQGSGLSVDNSEAAGALSDDAISERDILAGRWDAAELKMWEVDWSDVGRRRLTFAGSMGEVSRSNGEFKAELRGLAEPLNNARGRVFHPRCSARLGDAGCKMVLSGTAFQTELEIEGLDDGRIFRFSEFPAFNARWFERGVLRILDGEAAGLHGAIKNDISLPGGGREIELWQSLGLTAQTGDRVRLTAGCDKRAATCSQKFSNLLNFRGFPHLPSEDWLLAPQVGSRND
ncbi:DUF2163 domain-containing protein [Paracoccus sp. 11-3]|uniref:DUF2163 domain-containing protein n=1 Tax=Paracoccus amoyensis TaxID=2760093 RepID=A0A926GBV9_9RHOB|nr:DUF2163 domain-containing protein [Paracoccus amoyensis]MBC9245566.1 DUF2163 domain-containing protein [Paracoccus amoyensis]